MLHTTQNLSALMGSVGKPVDYVLSGFHELDQLIGGFRPGELVVVAARPKMGKTSYLMDLAKNISKTLPVMFLSLEMSGEALLERMLSGMALVPQERLHATDLSQDEITRIDLASRSMNELKLFIQDDPFLTPTKFKQYMKQFAERYTGPFVVMIDYLQMMRTDSRFQNRVYELQDIIDSVCAELKQYPAICIVTSQLNREADKRENHWPRLSDLRDSGYVEQAADKIIFIHRPDYYAVADGDFDTVDTGESYLIVAANRRGRAGFVKVAFISDITCFKNIGADDKIEIFDDKELPF